MYYYIFDIKKCKKRAFIEAIKSTLSELGISGEYNYILPSQSAEELASVGLKRGYSTIIAVGGDDLINSVANCMIGKKEAMGVIPLDISNSMASLLGVSGWREACESLRFRRIKEMFTGRAANGEHFLTEAYIDLSHPTEITVEFKNYIIQVQAKNFMISNFHPGIKKIGNDYLDVIIESEPKVSHSLVNQIKSLFAQKVIVDSRRMSIIHARSMRIFTKKPITLLAGGKVIGKTPQLVESTESMLRLIVSRKH
jgi:diacylglycerol kinase family enzyme